MNPATSNVPARLTVGLTGGIGSGKTLVAELFAARGAAVIDTDRIAHQLTEAGGAAIADIRSAFGERFITQPGALDRAKMREHVFSDPSARKQLEAILHPMIRQQCELAAASAQGPYLMVVVPLLVESTAWRAKVGRILVVDCPESLQIARVMQRNAMRHDQVLAIMATQASRQERLGVADDVIVNDATADDLIPEIDRLHALYTALSQIDRTKPA